MNVNDFGVWIVRIGKEYIVAVPYKDTRICRMSSSPYDAAPICDYASAAELANAVHGVAVYFNPVTGVVSR